MNTSIYYQDYTIRKFYKKKVINNVRVNTFFKINFDNTDDNCIICLNSLNNTENVKCYICNQIFHISCIIQWFDTSNNQKCPHCVEKWKFDLEILDKEVIYQYSDQYSDQYVNNYILLPDIHTIPHLPTDTVSFERNGYLYNIPRHILSTHNNFNNYYMSYLNNLN